MLLREIVVCLQDNTKQIYMVGKMQNYKLLMQVVHVVTTWL
jgi:hypothetical protein